MNKKFLFITCNPLGEHNNNGKTLLSIIRDYSEDNIMQFCYASSIPEKTKYKKIFQVTEKQIISALINGTNLIGGVVSEFADERESLEVSFFSKLKRVLRDNDLANIALELLWSYFLKHMDVFLKWYEKEKPDCIWIMDGKSIYAYKMALFLNEKYGTKIIVQLTDDYFKRLSGINPFKIYRKNQLEKYTRKILSKSEALITIGSHMTQEYYKKFGVNGIEMMNCVNLEEYNLSTPKIKSDIIHMVYAGSLYYGRDKILYNLAEAINSINKEEKCQFLLSIYSQDCIDIKKWKQFISDRTVEFGGFVESDKLKKTLTGADVLVFVEDFNKKNINKTWLSVSTKLPEYMAAGKCIFAIGPNNVGSMKYADEFACVCNKGNVTDIIKKLRTLENEEVRDRYAKIGLELVRKNHDAVHVRSRFNDILSKI